MLINARAHDLSSFSYLSNRGGIIQLICKTPHCHNITIHQRNNHQAISYDLPISSPGNILRLPARRGFTNHREGRDHGIVSSHPGDYK